MLKCVCVAAVVFSVCIVMRGAVGARAFIMCSGLCTEML